MKRIVEPLPDNIEQVIRVNGYQSFLKQSFTLESNGIYMPRSLKMKGDFDGLATRILQTEPSVGLNEDFEIRKFESLGNRSNAEIMRAMETILHDVHQIQQEENSLGFPNHFLRFRVVAMEGDVGNKISKARKLDASTTGKLKQRFALVEDFLSAHYFHLGVCEFAEDDPNLADFGFGLVNYSNYKTQGLRNEDVKGVKQYTKSKFIAQVSFNAKAFELEDGLWRLAYHDSRNTHGFAHRSPLTDERRMLLKIRFKRKPESFDI